LASEGDNAYQSLTLSALVIPARTCFSGRSGGLARCTDSGSGASVEAGSGPGGAMLST
jgi:hypothetical protein